MASGNGELPGDFGPRIRAAAAYLGVSLKEFATLCDRDGMSHGTLRAYTETAAKPRPLMRSAFVERLAEVSGLPKSFFLGGSGSAEEQLASIRDGIEALRVATAALDLEALRLLDGWPQKPGESQPRPRG